MSFSVKNLETLERRISLGELDGPPLLKDLSGKAHPHRLPLAQSG